MFDFEISSGRDGVSHFAYFLGSDEYIDGYRFRPGAEKPKCLLDLIELWIILGKATEICPTFESFLLTVVDIIEVWHGGEYTSIYGNPMWPLEREPDGEYEGADGEPITALFIPDARLGGANSSTASDHPILRPNRYVMDAAWRKAQRHQEMLERLERLDTQSR